MSRPFSFRVWDLDEKRMITAEHADYSWMFRKWEDAEVEIMQLTGLHDRNGKDIYEGDILSAEWLRGQKTMYTVEFRSSCFMADNVLNGKNGENGHEIWDTIVFHELYEYNHLIVVIGNRFENPNLLNQQYERLPEDGSPDVTEVP